MRISRGLLPAVVALSSLAGFAAERTPPPHPTVLFAEHQGQRYPVIAAQKDKPVIEVEGKRIVLPDDVTLSTERAPGYGGMSAKLEDVKGRTQLARRGFAQPGAKLEIAGFHVELSMKITPAQDLRDCFVVLLMFEEDFFLDEAGRAKADEARQVIRPRPIGPAQIRVREVPDLQAGRSTPVDLKSVYLTDFTYVNTPPPTSEGRLLFMAPLFSGGREVKTDQPEHCARYFHHREKLVHAALVKNWLRQNATGNQPLKPVQQIPPLLDSNEGLPPDATATLSVAPDGTVSEVSIDREFPPAAETVLTNTLHAWLFLPKIQHGVPVAAKVKLPLRF